MAQGRESIGCLNEQVNALAVGELLVGSVEPTSRSSHLRGRGLGCLSINSGQSFEGCSWGLLFFSISSLHAKDTKRGVAGVLEVLARAIRKKKKKKKEREGGRYSG